MAVFLIRTGWSLGTSETSGSISTSINLDLIFCFILLVFLFALHLSMESLVVHWLPCPLAQQSFTPLSCLSLLPSLTC